MVAANRAGAARSGFIHKYPTAYEGPKATIDHKNVAIDQIRSARKFRRKRAGYGEVSHERSKL
ncbi:hypothetical protein ABZX51_000474 [Aspergillus tubingensis]